MKKITALLSLIILIAVSLCSPCGYAAKAKPLPSPPDLTKGEKPDAVHDWTLGPTGARGWIWTTAIPKGASRDARQILVTKVDKGSPADGKLRVGDVIIGVNGKNFVSDARKAFANAITEAEKRKNAGRLALKVWRSDKVRNVVLTLKVMGSYSDTSPYDCPKTEAIIDMACDYLKDKKLDKGLKGQITALGLMATGRDDLLPKVKEYARSICKPGEVLNIETHQSMMAWHWSYKCLFLTEYYLRTGDKYVLPTIKEYATKIAMGQSGVGTWGHTVAAKANTGSLHGHLGGYGAMNQISVVCMMSMVLAEKCGVTNSEITQAIKKGDIFFSYYINKGAIPYGDHKPASGWFDDNGKCAGAAVMFDLMGNHRGAEFFSAMAVGHSPGGREDGHTGNFWGHLWGGIGAGRSGKEGLVTFFKEMRWYFDFERGWQGNVVFQGNPGVVGKNYKNGGWDCTGARLLQLCLPGKQLYITGKEMKVKNPLTGATLTEAIEAGRFITNSEGLKDLDKKKILRMLGHSLPPVRHFGAKALADRNINCVDTLIAMLDSKNINARYGACQALRVAGFKSERAVDALSKKVLNSDDLTLRLYAIDALTSRDLEKGLASAARPAIPALLKLAVSRSDDDPRRLLQRKLGTALFYGGRVQDTKGLIQLYGVKGIDRSLLIPAIKELLTVDDGRSRGCVGSIYPKLDTADLELLWGDIYLSVRDMSPSGIMFADGSRHAGLKLIQQHNSKEGIDLAVALLQEDRWGKGSRQKACLPILAKYGASAKGALPCLRKLQQGIETDLARKQRRSRKQLTKKDTAMLDQVKATIKAIENGKAQPLKSLRPYLKQIDARVKHKLLYGKSQYRDAKNE